LARVIGDDLLAYTRRDNPAERIVVYPDGRPLAGCVSARQSSGKRDVSERAARPEAARGHSIIALPDLQPGQRAPAGIG